MEKKRSFKQLKKEKNAEELRKFCRKMTEEYANSEAQFARSYFSEHYNISEKCFYEVIKYAIETNLVEDVVVFKAMEKAILASDVGITPNNDGSVLRLVFPQPTEERRQELAKQVMKLGEEAKVAIRNIRREANDAIKKDKKDGTMTEDEQKSAEKDIQDITDKYIKNIDAISDKKAKEIMQI